MERWIIPDPADQYFSPYVYCGNNPLIRIDPDGQFNFLTSLWNGIRNQVNNMFETTTPNQFVQETVNLAKEEIDDSNYGLISDEVGEVVDEGVQVTKDIASRTDKVSVEVKAGKTIMKKIGAEVKNKGKYYWRFYCSGEPYRGSWKNKSIKSRGRDKYYKRRLIR